MDGIASFRRGLTLLRAVSALLILGGLLSSQARAQNPALDFDSLGSGSDYYQGQYSLGWSFTANTNVQVNALGFYDSLKDGITVAHPVGIYRKDNCQLVASTTVQPGDTLIGFFRYRAITPVTLTLNTEYYIAALTTSPDPYAISVSTINVDPAITYGGFAIFGNTQSTGSLKCPNGTSTGPSFHGDFGPSFYIGGFGAIPTPGPTPTGGKKPTKAQIFCNRIGVNLETAKCTATVGDAGAPPILFPTGSVTFTAKDGFSPSSADCNLQPTSFAPLIGNCEATFSIPFDFPIGKRFPIDVTYTGDTNFDPSTTSHEIGVIRCTTNCPDTGGLSSADIKGVPRAISTVIDMLFLCAQGKVPTPANNQPTKPTCKFSLTGAIELAKVIDGESPSKYRLIGQSITPAQAKLVKALDNIKKTALVMNDFDLEKILRTNYKSATPNKLLQQLLETGKVRPSQLATGRTSLKAKNKKRKRAESKIIAGTVKATLRGNTQKDVQFKLNAKAQAVIEALKTAEFDSIPFTFNATTEHRDQKKPSKKSGEVDLVLE